MCWNEQSMDKSTVIWTGDTWGVGEVKFACPIHKLRLWLEFIFYYCTRLQKCLLDLKRQMIHTFMLTINDTFRTKIRGSEIFFPVNFKYFFSISTFSTFYFHWQKLVSPTSFYSEKLSSSELFCMITWFLAKCHCNYSIILTT